MYAERNNRIINGARVRDMAMRVYNERQLHEITPARVHEMAAKVLPASNFHYDGKSWQPNEYMGYAVVSMLNDNPGNENLAELLTEIQSELQINLQPLNGFYMLPPESFHQTIANTLSAQRFKDNILHAGLELSYPGIVEDAFNNIDITKQYVPVRMRMVGLSVFGTAIGILGTFEMDADYNRIINFRDGFYEDQQLAGLDVKMTRPFIGHITLAYIESKLNVNQKEHLANTVNEINAHMFTRRHYFNISHAGLRNYTHLAEFKNAASFPVYQFTI